jgi:hypothetical protein
VTDLSIEATVPEYWSHPGTERTRTQKELLDPEFELVILDAYQIYKSGPVILEKIINTHYGLAIPHNAIYPVMLMHQLIIELEGVRFQGSKKWIVVFYR